MSEKDKKILKALAEGIKDLSEKDKEYLMGIGEGLRLAKEKRESDEE